eukprot:594488-Prorocentrum_minimum.AAC.1
MCAQVGYLEQKGVSGSTKTVVQEVRSRMDKLVAATAALEAAEANMEVREGGYEGGVGEV